MKIIFVTAWLCLFITTSLRAQNTSHQTSLLWKVSGNGLAKPSYIFGTYHFLSNAFVDTLPAVIAAYRSSDAVVGELVFDSSLQGPMMEASMLKGTTLKQVLPDTVYSKAAAWFTREAGVELTQLEALNPVSVMTFAMAVTQQKYYPNPPGQVQLDSYFQQMAERDGKRILGLETIQAQIKALFGQMPIPRQAALLYEAVKEDDGLRKTIGTMNKAYISHNLHELQQLMYGSNYEAAELKALLDDRNNQWMEQLPRLMKEQSLFIAVGALHLTGKTGLIEQLRKMGYTATPLNL